MAGDTREGSPKSDSESHPNNTPPPSAAPLPSSSPDSPPPPHSHKVYETFSPPANANVLPGGTTNTAGGAVEDVSIGKAVKTIKLEDFTNVHRQPCVRDSLLAGILGGFGMGGVRAVLGASIPKASNWAVGTFCTVSFAAYEVCQYRRHREQEGMRRAVEIIDRKKIEREQKMQQTREARRKAKEEEDKKAEEQAKQKKGWKFW
ncbi:MAG: hypothetical protein M1837_002202 [Sclerophora amabilis]|nr:MAG: hypothetical protein M1837_002202 [Sclerophora amabilis]